MSVIPQESRVTIVVKALPQPSSKHGETVCCAGLTSSGAWKRLYPVRFRHLTGDSSFNRWDWVDFKYRRPTHDSRVESCHVFEDTIRKVGSLHKGSRGPLLCRVLQPSIEAASAAGQSLAVIRPASPHFTYKKKSQAAIDREKAAYEKAARQTSFLDEELRALQPTPYEFKFSFQDGRKHVFTCADWEAHAMFYNERLRTNEQKALQWMMETFNEVYPRAGMLFAVGNQAKRPQTWQLLGILRVDGLQALLDQEGFSF